jgi:hypothetical protein
MWPYPAQVMSQTKVSDRLSDHNRPFIGAGKSAQRRITRGPT